MFKLGFPTVALVCSLASTAAFADPSAKVGPTTLTLDPRASAYESSLSRLLTAPQQYRVPAPEQALADMLETLTPLPEPGMPVKGAPLPPKDRGDVDWAQVYEKTAPAVVFLAGDAGFGTGFVIDADQRWVVTNHHVARAAAMDSDRHWAMNAYFGHLGDDGVMQPSDHPTRAVVYKWNPQCDLALLKLEAGEAVPGELRLGGDKMPRAGEDVALLGNGALGLLWAMKPGHIASMGTLSRNLPFLVSRMNQVHGLDPSAALQPGVLERLQEEIGRGFEGWIGGNTLLIQATAEASQGDSGGPLVDPKARVMGIAMGLRVDQETARSVSYFIHVDEIRKFIEDTPSQPLLEVATSFWQTNAVAYGLADATGDGRIDLIQGYDAQQNLVMCAMDLDQDTALDGLYSEVDVQVPVVGVFPLSGGSLTVYENGIMIAAGDATAWHQRQAGHVVSAAMAPDGALGAMGFADGSVAVFDAASGASSWRKAIDGTPVTAMAFCSPSTSLWMGTAAGTVVEVSATGDLVRQIALQNGVTAMAISPNGQYVAVGELGGPLRCYDATNGKALYANPDVRAYALRFSRDSHHLVASPQGDVKQLYWMNSWSGEVKGELHLPASPYSFELSEDGTSVAVLLHDEARYVVIQAQSGDLMGSWGVSDLDGKMLLDRLLAGSPGSNRPVATFCYRDGKLLTGDATGTLYDVDILGAGEARGFHHRVVAPDLNAMVSSHAFDAEFAWMLDSRSHSCYVMYDLDNDEQFELIRVDDAADMVLDSVYRRENGELVRENAQEEQGVFLAPSQLPAAWQANYLVSLGGS